MIAYDVAVHLASEVGVRTAGSAAERRAQTYLARRFARAGLRVAHDRFALPGGGRDRNVLGIWDGSGTCLTVFMAHIDTVAGSPGGADNATGVGVLAGLAPKVVARRPRCDVWLVATGAEERVYTGADDHLGALALVRRLRRESRTRDVGVALSIDMLGRGTSYWVRAPQATPGANARRILGAARRAGVDARYVPDTGTGNSDHRELALAGLPGALLSAPQEFTRCHHQACDDTSEIRRPALRGAQRLAEGLL